MLYVSRDEGGNINGVYANPQPDYATEELADDDAVVVAYLNPPPVPSSISDRQFFQQLAVQGIITQAEALAAVRVGAIPAALQSIVDTIVDPAHKFAAQMLLSGAVEFRRDHPLTGAIGASYGWGDAQIDALFVAAAVL